MIHVNVFQYVYIVKHVRTSICMFQSADQHQSHLLTWGCIQQRGILVAVQLAASKSHHLISVDVEW